MKENKNSTGQGDGSVSKGACGLSSKPGSPSSKQPRVGGKLMKAVLGPPHCACLSFPHSPPHMPSSKVNTSM